MVHFTVDQVRTVMDKQTNIRNISVIAHVDHGKSTLTDSLMARAGLMSEDHVSKRGTDIGKEEQERGITIKSTGVSLMYDYEKESITEPYLVNLIDSPGHVDFSSEVTAALRVTDGALVVVDCIEGACVQTGTVLRQALHERIKPVLMINKVDRAILELKKDPEEIYQNFLRVIEEVNVIISTHDCGAMGDLQLDPQAGTVAFGSGLHGWAFTIPQFAKIYAKAFKISEEVMREKLWGDHFFDPKAKKWRTTNKNEKGEVIPRAFCHLVLEPIIKLAKHIMEGNEEIYKKLIKKLGITLKEKDWEKKEKKLLKTVMQKWINAADALVEVIIEHLPSPVQAQKYRCEYLYEGPQDDEIAQAIRACDPNGPLMMYVSKMVESQDKGRFYAFGRVFSGTISTGDKVRIMGPNYVPGKDTDLFQSNIRGTCIMMAGEAEGVPSVTCGNTVALVGIDKFLTKTGTITDNPNAHNIKVMQFSVSPVVRVAIQPKSATDLPKLVSGLQRLVKSDPVIQCTKEETGEFVVAGSGELHVEVSLNNLVNDFAKIEIIKSDPVVTYQETITEQSSVVCLAKSPNKHNRLYAVAEPLSEEIVKAIETGDINTAMDMKNVGKKFVEEYEWDPLDAKKIWCFGPEIEGTNVLVDQTKGLQYMNEIRDSMQAAFLESCHRGVLTGENLRGIKMNVVDAVLHADAVHRGGGQIIPAARRAYAAAELSAKPRIVEPIYLVNIVAPQECVGAIYQCLSMRRGMVVEENYPSQNVVEIRGHLPVAESFGFNGKLREMTSGQAFPQCSFDHWRMIETDPLEVGTQAHQLVESIRERKAMSAEFPQLSDYIDRL